MIGIEFSGSSETAWSLGLGVKAKLEGIKVSPGDSATFLIYVILEIWVGDCWEGWGIAAMDDSAREREREREREV